MTLTQGQTKILVAAILSAIIPLLLYRYVTFKPVLSPAENAVAQFSPTPPATDKRIWHYLATAQNPLGETLTAPPAATAQKKSVADISAQAPPPVVTFILQGNGKGMAIIDGNVVREGEKFRNWRITRIERNRILLEGRKGTIWANLE